ncbi:MAG: hypothetical protein WBN99_10135 [Mycobacterium sp.]
MGCVSRSTSGLNDKSSTGAAGCWRLQGTNLRPGPGTGIACGGYELGPGSQSVVGLRLPRHRAVSLGAAQDTFDAAFAARTIVFLVMAREKLGTGASVRVHHGAGAVGGITADPDRSARTAPQIR